MSNVQERLSQLLLANQNNINVTVPRAFLIELRSELLQASAAAVPDLDALVQKQNAWNREVIGRWLQAAHHALMTEPPARPTRAATNSLNIRCQECEASMCVVETRGERRRLACTKCQRRTTVVGNDLIGGKA